MRSRIHRVRHLVLLPALLALSLVTACSSDDDPAAPAREPAYTAEEVAVTIVEPQADRDAVLADLLEGGMNQTTALDSVVTLFRADPEVATAEAGPQGIGVRYANGMIGGILLDFEDEPDVEAPPTPAHDLDAPPALKDTPLESVFLNAHYSDRVTFADPIRDNYGNLLQDAGYGVINVFLDDDVTLDQYTALGDRRIVHIYSHGMAWPTSTNIQEVYLMSGERFSQETYDEYWEDVEDGHLPVIHVHRGTSLFLVSPEFISKYNNFGDDTLVYGGFCYSFLGRWPEVMAQEQVGGYIGFDWSVLTSFNASSNIDLMQVLLDDDPEPPPMMNDWLTNDTVKHYERHGRVVHLRYQGDQTLTLRDESELECEDTVIEHGDGYVRGIVHVTEGGAPADEVPVRIDYRKIHCDGSVGRVDPVDAETGPGGVYAAGMVGVFTLDNSQDLVIVRATLQGQVQEKVYRIADFAGLEGSNLLVPLQAEFAFYF
jgi:hypothetical protein